MNCHQWCRDLWCTWCLHKNAFIDSVMGPRPSMEHKTRVCRSTTTNSIFSRWVSLMLMLGPVFNKHCQFEIDFNGTNYKLAQYMLHLTWHLLCLRDLFNEFRKHQEISIHKFEFNENIILYCFIVTMFIQCHRKTIEMLTADIGHCVD